MTGINIKLINDSVVLGLSNDESFKKLSHFAIDTWLGGLAGETNSVETLRNGSLLLECATERHSKTFPKSKQLCIVPISVTPHTTLHFSM